MKGIFPIIAPGSGAIWVLLAIALALLVGALLLANLAITSRTARLELGPDGLRIRSPLYGRTIAWSSVLAEGARSVNLKTETQLAPRWRTNGIGLPGYRAGWFRLRNGEKALAFLTDSTRVALIPTREFTVLVSVADPDALVVDVRRLAGPGFH